MALLFIQNDPADNWRATALDTVRPFFVEEGDSLRLDTSFRDTPAFRRWESRKWLLRHSVLWAQLRRSLATLRTRQHPPRVRDGVVEDGYYRDWNFDPRLPADSIPAFRLTEKVLARLGKEVSRDGRRFVVFLAGFAHQEDRALLEALRGDPAFDPENSRRWLRAVGERHGFDVVPLTPEFRAASAATGLPLWFGSDGKYGRWNERGHAVAARAIERALVQRFAGLDTTESAAPGAAIR